MSDLVDLSKLEPGARQRAVELASQIRVDDAQAIVQYGVGAQSQISSFADSILNQIRFKDSGYVGDVLTDLVVKIKDLNVEGLASGGFLKNVPILGALVSSVQRFITRYDKISAQIEKILGELETARMNLLKDITLLEQMHAKNLDYLKELDIFVAAGKIKIDELRTRVVPEMEAKAKASGDPIDAQRLQDFVQFLDRFEKKLHDLMLSRMLAIQTGPQLRLIQNNNQLLVEKIQSSIFTTIPLWKNQVVIAISLFRQKKALELQKEVTKTTNDLLANNMEMLKQRTIETARESERGIVNIETLQKVNGDLIATIEETLTIHQEGRSRRQAAEAELNRMEAELKARLSSVRR